MQNTSVKRKRSSKILLCWELGGGAGHLICLRTIARALMDAGHQTALCLPAGSDVSLFRDLGWISIIETQKPPSIAGPFQAASFADVLGRTGYSDPLVLRQRIAMWRELLISQAADVVLGDFAPSANFAATGIVPTIAIGSGYATPPANQPTFGVLNPNAVPVYDQANLTDNAWRVACELGFSASLDSVGLPSWVAADQSFVRSYRQFDPYAQIRKETSLGPLHDFDLKEFDIGFQRESPSKFFAYLSGDHPNIDDVVAGLCQAKSDGNVFASRLSQKRRDALNRSHLTVLSELADWSTMLPQVSLLIHHAGLGSAQAAAAVGVPQLVIPGHLEQELTGLSILRHGIGAALVPPFTSDDVALGVERVMTAPSYRKAAKKLATELATGGPYRFVERVVKATEALL